MSHDDIFGFGPILNGKILDINMTRTLSGDTVVDHIDGRHIVFIEPGWIILRVSKFQKDGTQILCVFCRCDSGNKLSFGARGSSGGHVFLVSSLQGCNSCDLLASAERTHRDNT